MKNIWNSERKIFKESFPQLREIKYKNNNFYIFDVKKWSIPFELNNDDIFTKEEILKAFEFAFESKDKHRSHRSGGIEKRDNIKIFFNIFLGKLGEIATYNYLKKYNLKINRDVDYLIKEIGDWDNCDLILDDNKTLSIKSSKFYSNMLLLEKKDYNEKGELIYNIGTDKVSCFDYFSYVRVAPTKFNKISFVGYGINFIKKTNDLKEELKNFILDYNWYYEEPFIITKDLFVNTVIKNNYCVKQGFMMKFDLNENVLLNLSKKNPILDINLYLDDILETKGFVLDADNYYFPLKYMYKIKNLKRI